MAELFPVTDRRQMDFQSKVYSPAGAMTPQRFRPAIGNCKRYALPAEAGKGTGDRRRDRNCIKQ